MGRERPPGGALARRDFALRPSSRSSRSSARLNRHLRPLPRAFIRFLVARNDYPSRIKSRANERVILFSQRAILAVSRVGRKGEKKSSRSGENPVVGRDDSRSDALSAREKTRRFRVIHVSRVSPARVPSHVGDADVVGTPILRAPRGANYTVRNVNLVRQAVSARGGGIVLPPSTLYVYRLRRDNGAAGRRDIKL